VGRILQGYREIPLQGYSVGKARAAPAVGGSLVVIAADRGLAAANALR
jgi:hypothetical protein